MMAYIPTATDKFFARSIVSLIKDGGLWALPDSGMAFNVFHDKARDNGFAGVGPLGRLVLCAGPCDDELFDKTREVFALVGYAVVRGAPLVVG